MKDYSNYHNINTNAKFAHDGELMLNEILENGFESYDAILNNDKQIRIVMTSKYASEGELRGVIGHISDIERGSLLEIEGNQWLIFSLPDDNKIFRKANIRLCNSTFRLEFDKTTVLMRDEEGNLVLDKYERPIPIEVEGKVVDEPCIVESKYYFNNRNEQITLPEDRILVSMKYQEVNNIGINKEFDLYKSKFRITFIDYSKVVNGTGVMTLTGERVMAK
ncbi:hypothetical protein [Lederbergia lenta]|uniref:hypothetical protein n=1 Tax=Lederbergia lenta TaxID=1467 RepID=UPI00203E2B77|nr:hypothetical protein [Lederbergia lenta]MCM3110034.1 hypothetical protein [Lederbergia lenta]